MRYYTPKELNFDKLDNKEMLKQWKDNHKLLQDIDKEAKKSNKILGRYITEPFADGNAFYQIIKVNKRTCKIRVCTGLGDDWVIPYWGREAIVDKKYILQLLLRKDGLDEIFGRTE